MRRSAPGLSLSVQARPPCASRGADTDSHWTNNQNQIDVLDKVVSLEDCEPEVPPVIESCTFTIGWYKNHTTQWPAGYAPNDIFFTSGRTWLQVFNTPPRGDAYYILATQYMAATMNAADGGSHPEVVTDGLDRARDLLAAATPGQVSKADSAEFTSLAATLDSYNNGELGVAHCD
ncbi:MAG: hypothetical protein Q4G46_00715 [Propionibacteriaceae bacterium]|nr:hypothetical protein [Propionibacteriaceae bacterium]